MLLIVSKYGCRHFMYVNYWYLRYVPEVALFAGHFLGYVHNILRYVFTFDIREPERSIDFRDLQLNKFLGGL